MALVITVGGANITAYVYVETLAIEETADEMVATCRFEAHDHSETIAIEPKDAITIVDGATTLFAGEVADIAEDQRGLTRIWRVTCQDNHILLDETAVASASVVAESSDSDVLAALFAAYRVDVDATTYVSTVDSSLEAVTWTAMTLREILDDLCSRTGARYYIDHDKALHYFTTEANAAAWNLSTSPDGSTTKGYGGFRRVSNAARLANKVLVYGKDVSGWVSDAASIAAYGERHAVSRDQRITTAQGVTDRGDALLDRYDLPRVTYELWTEADGLRAGMSIELTNEVWGITAQTLYIRSIKMSIVGKGGDTRRYQLALGDTPSSAARSARHQLSTIGAIQTSIGEINATVFDGDAPAAPTALGAGNVATGVETDADGHQIVYAQITWAEVSDADLDHYVVQLAAAADFASGLQTRMHPDGGDRLERFVGLLGNTTYYVRVRAVDWVGNPSAWDYGAGSPYSFTTAKDTTAPGQVDGLSGASSRTLVGLSWTASSAADLRHYEIQRAPDSTGSPGEYATIALAQLNFYIDQDFSDAQIAAADTFWYRVRAVDTSGNAGDWATAVDVELGQITHDHIAAGTITADEIAANTITAAKIAAGTITATQIAASTITADRMNVATLSAIAADMGTLTAGEIRVGTGTVGSNFTGFRIYGTQIGGFNSETLQVGIRASDGKLVAGGGNVFIDSDGVGMEPGTGRSNAVTWEFAANELFEVRGFADATLPYGRIKATTPDGAKSAYVQVYAENTYPATDVNAVLAVGADATQAGMTLDAYGSQALAIVRSASDAVGTATLNVVLVTYHSVFINDSANAKMTKGLTINQGAADDEILALKSSDVAHGMTDVTETDTYGNFTKSQDTSGGMTITGFKDGDGVAGHALGLNGRLGMAADTAKTTSAYGVVVITARIKSGTGVAAVGSNGNLVTIRNAATTRFIFDAEGSAHADVEWTTYDDYDDVALLTDLERAMLAQRDPVKAGFVDFLQYNHNALEAAGIVHFDRENPGHAMVNTTKLSMALVGAIRQMNARMDALEARMLTG